MWLMKSTFLSTLVYFQLIVLGESIADLSIISKSKWNGKEAAAELTKLELPVGRVIICHTMSAACDTQATCAQRLQMIQAFQMNQSHFDDIAYNFLIGNDGNVYEGRGWDYQGAFARGFNAGSIGIAFIGTFGQEIPTDAALQAAHTLLESGTQLRKIDESYKLLGHRQVGATESPGAALYEVMKQWPHWSRNL